MDLFGINGYSLEKRAKLVLEQGAFVSSRSTGKYSLCLYHMGSFFAEVWYLEPGNKIVLVRGFNDEASLEPYLRAIDVSELMH
ncbi:hypothetical protein [Botryobacter ruber]|uniref:hypothetical protein n=1 Tax=Botryobacter ruber TaxID=2171629 RepID=UPI000E0C917B|nr:hypothetical protein [Botryobacter ruber]